VIFVDGEVLGVLAFGLLGILLLLVPFLDKQIAKEEGRLLNVIGVVLLLYVAAMTLMGYVV